MACNFLGQASQQHDPIIHQEHDPLVVSLWALACFKTWHIQQRSFVFSAGD